MIVDIEEFIQIMNEIPQAAAVIDPAYFVHHANKHFKNLFDLQITAGREHPCVPLQKLDLAVRNGKLTRIQKVRPARHSQAYNAAVFLLKDVTGQDRRYLVLIHNQETQPDSRSPFAAIASPFPGEEKLSDAFSCLVGEDIRFKTALLHAQRMAQSDLPVLILGASGTGKELLARSIHRTSKRVHHSLVDVNCAAIPDSLIESEMFGYEKGAFTGANVQGRTGYFDEAHGGTLLLDEVADASPQVQAKLLRVLEEGCFKRVGGNKNVQVNVRLISSTNKDLTELITRGLFREDLFYRLNTMTIYLPALSERKNDIPLLIQHFLNLYIRKEKKEMRMHPETLDILIDYTWPGNVRELKAVMDYAMNMTNGLIITPDNLPLFVFSNKLQHKQNIRKESHRKVHEKNSYDLNQAVKKLEKSLMEEALAKWGNKTEVIARLGISRGGFYKKMKEYGLDRA